MSFRVTVFMLFMCTLDAKSVAVDVVKVTKGSLTRHGVFMGIVKYTGLSRIASQQQGIVDKIHVEVGDRVVEGKELISLNSDILRTEVALKKAKLQQARFGAEKIRNQLARYKNLLDVQSIALQQYENLEFELKSHNANISALKADLDLSRERLSKTIIRSPISGMVVECTVNVGEWIRTGDIVAMIVDSSQLEVVAHVPSSIIDLLKIRDKVTLSSGGKNYSGYISALVPKVDTKSQSVPVHIRLNKQVKFVDGMSVDVKLNTSDNLDGFIVPRDSIVHYMGSDSIFVVRNGKAVNVKVTVLNFQEKQAVVIGNVRDSDFVVIKGQDRLHNGAMVNLVGQKPNTL